MANVNVNMLYQEIQMLQKEVEKTNALLLCLVPEVKAGKAEMSRLKRIKAEMDAGSETPYSKDLF